MELIRYIVVFLGVVLGGGLCRAAILPVELGLLALLRGHIRGAFVAIATGTCTLLAVLLSYWLCGLTGRPPSYSMFAVAMIALLLNDVGRISRAIRADHLHGQTWENDPAFRSGVLLTEQLGLAANVLGAVTALLILPSLRLI